MLMHHLYKLVFYIKLLLAAFVLYFIDSERLNFVAVLSQGLDGAFLWLVWLALAVPMLFRLVPNRRIAMGARKHFACSYEAVSSAKSRAGETVQSARRLHKGAVFSGLGWFVITAAMLFALSRLNLLNPSTVLLVALTYAVVDLVFVLFFCPFRALFMRNHCCVTCRIHNWDYFMKCAPLILFPSVYSISLFVLAAAVVLRWEVSLRRNPRFFSRESNKNLHCGTCVDKLCQLRVGRPKK